MSTMVATLAKRASLSRRLAEALRHLPIDRQIDIVSSFIGLDSLEDIVKFQEDRS